MIILLLGCHIYTTIRTKGIQRKLPLGPQAFHHEGQRRSGATSATSAPWPPRLPPRWERAPSSAGTVLSGGSGAVLWMWLTGILGMATKYTEVYAAMKYRVKDRRGHMMGGAMHVMGAAL